MSLRGGGRCTQSTRQDLKSTEIFPCVNQTDCFTYFNTESNEASGGEEPCTLRTPTFDSLPSFQVSCDTFYDNGFCLFVVVVVVVVIIFWFSYSFVLLFVLCCCLFAEYRESRPGCLKYLELA